MQLVPFVRIVLLFTVLSDLKESTRLAAQALIDSYQTDILTYQWIANICLSHPNEHPLVDKIKKLALTVDKLGSLLMLFARAWHRNTLPKGCIPYKCWCSDWANELITFLKQILASHLQQSNKKLKTTIFKVLPLGVYWFVYYPFEGDHRCKCVTCGKEENTTSNEIFNDCLKCLQESPLVLHRYCSSKCSKEHWAEHKEYHNLFAK